MAIRRLSVAALVLVLVAVATLLMAMLAGWNYVRYRDEVRADLRRDFVIQADQLAVGLALPVWNIDRPQIDRILDAVEHDRSLFAIEVDAAGKRHRRVRDAQWRLVDPGDDPGPAMPSAGLLLEERPITLSGERVGSLRLYGTARFLEEDFRATLVSIVASILAVDVLLILSFYLVLWRAVIKPLVDIERYAVAVKSGEGGGAAIPDPRTSASELHSLRSSIQAMVALLDRRYEAVRASEKKYRDIVDFSPIGIYQALPDGTLVTANLAFARVLGRERVEDVLALNAARDVYLDPAERARLIARYQEVGHASRIELRLKRGDGTPFWAEMTAHAVKDAEGRTLYFESFVQDIEARKAAEDSLRSSEERYRLLFEGNPVPMLVHDLDTLRFLAANLAAVEQYGYSREELLRLSVIDLAVPGDENLDVFLATRFDPRPPIVHVGRRQQRRQDATIVDVEMTTLAIVFDGRPARLALARDVTAEARAQAEQERLQESLRRSESMAAMGSLVAGVAHEVRNPLFSISATVDALDSELRGREEFADLGRLLRAQVARLTQLMRDLLDYGKPPGLRLAAVQPGDPVRAALRACAPLARTKEIELTELVAAGLPALPIDASRMEQVFENLLANAVHHAPRRSRVRLAARMAEGNGAAAVEFTVEDEGPGILETDVDRLFEPFFSRRAGGTGLGLPIVQRIVEAHGGQVRGANRADGGAVFTVTLPVRPAPA